MTSKHPNCGCAQKRYEYFLKRYRNQTLHLIRRCAECGKTAQNPMRQDEYDRSWVESLPVMENCVMEQPVQSRAEPVRSTRQAVKPKGRVQSALMQSTRNYKGISKAEAYKEQLNAKR